MSNVDYFISSSFIWCVELAYWWELSLIYVKNMGNVSVYVYIHTHTHVCIYANMYIYLLLYTHKYIYMNYVYSYKQYMIINLCGLNTK